MSTNSRLRAEVTINGIKKVLKPIYCHWDGYPEYMLPMLNENYNSDEKVKELMELGNLSVLKPKVKPDEGVEHSFENPANNVTIAYHRDRGEDLEFWYDKREYNYVYHNNEWILDFFELDFFE